MKITNAQRARRRVDMIRRPGSLPGNSGLKGRSRVLAAVDIVDPSGRSPMRP
jgi:hypothetical protein